MGEARARGSFEDRQAQAVKEEAVEEAEVLIFLKAKDGQLNVQILPRDESPDHDSPAVILAAFLNANMDELAKAAIATHAERDNPEAGRSLKLISPRGGWVN